MTVSLSLLIGKFGVISSAAGDISTKTVDKPVGKLFSYPVMQALQSMH